MAQDISKGVITLRKQADKGYGPAMCLLGRCFETGTGVNQNLDEAAQWYDAASDEGSQDAYYYLALMYVNGYQNGTRVEDGLRMLSYLADAGFQPAIEAVKQYYGQK